jgi:hypothetical protein
MADDDRADGPIDVVATARGYFGHLRERGERFRVPSAKQFSARWMRVDQPAEEAQADEQADRRTPAKPRRGAAV